MHLPAMSVLEIPSLRVMEDSYGLEAPYSKKAVLRPAWKIWLELQRILPAPSLSYMVAGIAIHK